MWDHETTVNWDMMVVSVRDVIPYSLQPVVSRALELGHAFG
jgi:hypothetical protein